MVVGSAPDPAGPNAGFAALDGVGAGTSWHYPRIRKGSAQLPLGIPPYPGDRIAPKLVADAPDGGCRYRILASRRGREGTLSRPSLVQGRRNAPTGGPSRPWRHMA